MLVYVKKSKTEIGSRLRPTMGQTRVVQRSSLVLQKYTKKNFDCEHIFRFGGGEEGLNCIATSIIIILKK